MGNFQKTPQSLLNLPYEGFSHLLNYLLDAIFQVFVKGTPHLIQLADYYQLTGAVKNLEEPLLDGYK